MSYKAIDTRRLRGLLNEALKDHEINAFFMQNRRTLIGFGEKLQNLPANRPSALAAVIKVLDNERAVRTAESAFRKLLRPIEDKSVTDIVQGYVDALQGNIPAQGETLRDRARPLLYHLLGDSPVENIQEIFAVRAEPSAARPSEVKSDEIAVPISELELEALSDGHLRTVTANNALSQPAKAFLLALQALRHNDLTNFRKFHEEISPADVRFGLLEGTFARYLEDLQSAKRGLQGIALIDASELDAIEDIEVESAEFLGFCARENSSTFGPKRANSIIEIIGLWRNGHLFTMPEELRQELLPLEGRVIAFDDRPVPRPHFEEVGVWTVQKYPTDKPIHYRIAKQTRPVYELVEIAGDSTQYDAIRGALKAYVVKSNMRAVFRLADGVIVKHRRDHHELLDEAFEEPLDAWTKLEVLRWHGRQLVIGPLPDAQFSLDCRSDERLLPIALRAYNQQSSIGMSKRQIQQIADSIRTVTIDFDSRRLKRIRSQIGEVVAGFKSMDEISDELIKHPKIVQEIEARIKNIEARFVSERGDLIQDIKRLQTDKAQLDQAIRERSAEQSRLPAQVAKKVKEAFEVAVRDGSQALADSSLIGVLLGAGLLGEKANEANAAIDAKMVPAAPVEPTKERWTVLLPDKEDFSKILIEAGMPAGLARRVSRSIAVALAAGLMIVISGTASSMIARRLARALADIGVASAPIVIGAVEPVFSVSDIKVADRDWDVVALESFDLAPIESYGQEILNAVAEQIVGRAVLVTHVFCSGTDGISALPLSASVRKLCYAVDLDKRAYGETDETLDDWHSRMADESEDVQKDVRPWNVVLKRVLKALGEVPKDESTALLPIIEYGLCGKLVM